MQIHQCLAAALLVAAPAVAATPGIHFEGGFARAGLANAAAYVTVHNGGPGADRLLGASSPAATAVSVHATTNQGGVMRMRSAGPLAIAAKTRIAMKPGGLHLMLTGLKAPLRAGTKLPLTLRFARAGTKTISLPVIAPGADAPNTQAHHHGQ